MTFNFTFETQVSFNQSVYFNELIRKQKQVVKHSNLCLKMRLIEGVTELRKSVFC